MALFRLNCSQIVSVKTAVRVAVLTGALVSVMVGTTVGATSCKGRERRQPATSGESEAAGVVAPVYSKVPANPSLDHVALVDISEGLPEVYMPQMFGPPRARAFVNLVQFLRRVESGQEPRVKGLVISFGNALLGFAQVQELARIFGRIRSKGKPIGCHAHNLNNASYWLAASACDSIWISPAGGVDTVGIAGQVLYARRLLSELKVDVDMLQVGKYKGAEETFTRDGPSPEARESLMKTLTSIRTQWIDGITAGRAQARGRVESGPYGPKEALELGLVDGVGFLRDAVGKIRTEAKTPHMVRRFGPGSQQLDVSGFVEMVRVLSGADGAVGPAHVAVVRAIGSISMQSSGAILVPEEGITERELTRTLVTLGKDEAVRAVVLRIDSPGGSALASDLIWRQVMDLRSVKPVIVSVGSMAASGGYYIACAGTRIFAEPTSIVGSIGVVGGKFGIGRSLDHVGVTAETFPASDQPGALSRAAYLSPFVPWDDSTRERVLVTMRSVYDLFVERVVQGRKLTKPQVQQFAEGRLFASEQALAQGMVDELGGLQAAIEYAVKVAGVRPDAVKLVEPDNSLLKALELTDDGDEQMSGAVPRAGNWLVQSMLASAAPRDVMHHVGSFEPWLHGERTVVAVPYAFLLR